MPRYALLVAPSANRVYAEAAPRLAAAELAILSRAMLDVEVGDIEQVEIAGLPYLGFATDRPLGDAAVARLSNLSAAYALFGVEGDLLRPVRLRPTARFDSDLITIPKYAGKTNEQFTKLLLNVTLAASAHARDAWEAPLTVLDPLCGRGTTLNQALMYGHHALGVELREPDVNAYAAFLRTYLRRKRIKHRADTHPVRRERRVVARQFEALIDGWQRVSVWHADTIEARRFLRAGSADVIVMDAPYGIAHGSRAGGALSRRPQDLLAAAAPGWRELLRPGGALGMSWNTHVASRAEAAAILAAAGFALVESAGYGDLAHWVDQAITRDVLVATPVEHGTTAGPSSHR